jgi:hypothetical protein
MNRPVAISRICALSIGAEVEASQIADEREPG